jgi:predicted neuraminidase
MLRITLFAVVFTILSWTVASSAAEYREMFIFPPDPEGHGHVHASCIVECPNGDLRAVWYENGQVLPAPYYNEDRDKRDDVRIGGAYLKKDAPQWNAPFVMADTFGVSDNNPCMVVDKSNRLWLFYPTLLGVPDWTWGSGLLRYHVAADYESDGPPSWIKSNILVPHVTEFAEVIFSSVDKAVEEGLLEKDRAERYREHIEEELQNPLAKRIGWMCRTHPIIRSDGALILPLSNENFDVPIMAITQDGGETWTFSEPVPESGLTQPTLVEYEDGVIAAFFRNSSEKIKTSQSYDGGMTWSRVEQIDLPHPGAGIEAILGSNENLLMIYNDKTESPRDRLAVSISEDRGKTWKWTRHLENTPGGRFDYPSIVRGRDGTFHATYSYNLETIKYVHFDEDWIKSGDPK